MELGLFQQQTLKLVMTTELRQAITLLQYTATELQEFIEEQALENPLIDLVEASIPDKPNFKESWDFESWQQSSEQRNPFDYITKSEVGLKEFVHNQIAYLDLRAEEKKALSYLVDSLDENGYLHLKLEEAAIALDVSLSSVEKALQQLQTMEPAGIGARTLQECLLIQLKQLQPRHLLAETIVSQHLETFAGKKWPELAKILNIELPAIQAVYDLLQKLTPRPGAVYGEDKPAYVVPELTVKRVGHHYEVLLNDQSIPQIHMNKHYQKLLRDDSQSEAAKYIQAKYQQVMWLMKSLEQRKATLLKVMAVILEKQEDFFDFGPHHLKPMTLKEVAEEAGIHESTVSRAAKNKYVQTPHGVFELKSFFTSGLRTESGVEASAHVVKDMIKALVDGENSKKPLSDQKLADLLKKEKGIVVSRRTVAKYREQLNIPSSSKRKRF